MNQPTLYSVSNVCSNRLDFITSMSATAVAGPAVADRLDRLTATAVLDGRGDRARLPKVKIDNVCGSVNFVAATNIN